MSRKLRPELSDQQIINAYLRLRSVEKARLELGIPYRRAAFVLMSHGVERDGLKIYRQASQCYPVSIQHEIVKLHTGGVSHTRLCRMFGGSVASIKQAILRNGGVLLPGTTSRQKIDPDTISKVCALYVGGASQDAIAIQTGIGQTVISRLLQEGGVAARRRMAGESHPRWRGGRTKTGQGYVWVKVMDSDPFVSMRNRSGYALEHRLTLARHLGRPLLPTETVHHINGDRADNRLENLQLRQGRHGKNVALVCLCCGSQRIGPAPLEL